jgi:hypothetical protein
LRRRTHEQVQKLYDLTVKSLLGAAKDQFHLSLSDISDDQAGPGTPPTHKGPQVVLKKLTDGQVFQKLQQIGDTELAQRASETQNWLSKVAHDQRIGPKDTVGELLNRLFGKDAVEIYGQRKWQSQPMMQQQAPRQRMPMPPQSPNPPGPNPMMPTDQAMHQPPSGPPALSQQGIF